MKITKRKSSSIRANIYNKGSIAQLWAEEEGRFKDKSNNITYVHNKHLRNS